MQADALLSTTTTHQGSSHATRELGPCAWRVRGRAVLHALRQARRRPRRIEPLLLVGKCIFTRGIARSRGGGNWNDCIT